MATKTEVEQENAELRARIAELEAQTGIAARPAPVAPSFGMSEGTRQDVEHWQQVIRASAKLKEVRLVDPFTGKPIVVTGDDVVITEDDKQPADDAPAAGDDL